MRDIEIQEVKRRYGIIGTSPAIDRAIQVAIQVASTDLTVLINGESGVGKENFPKIIHDHSAERKHRPYVAINCGAIPEGTVDSELFGHEKGSFTGAVGERKGYFEEANGGTIFLDEVGELPASTQARLLRVLETGEFMRVGSSESRKTNVRVVAATNVNIPDAIASGKFREDLYYRLNTVPIIIPPLRERKNDILLLFKKFAFDFSEKYRMPEVELTPEAELVLKEYYWPGNVRQLKNVTEQISIIEQERVITVDTLRKYIDVNAIPSTLPVLYGQRQRQNPSDASFERELIFKFLADMQKDINELKRYVSRMNGKEGGGIPAEESPVTPAHFLLDEPVQPASGHMASVSPIAVDAEIIPDSLSLQEKEKEMIVKALQKNNGRRRETAVDLGISERTLYRKLKEYQLDTK
ncbi:MAG: sigma-54-dependent Fis family transcriptional regulator [Bacteroidales bacterium]|jgi:DNA-binding NtrC family response regulator|nr:sigma-54-dependent Fis family transcriptional regulator [Bacteroidales bacterium]MBR4492322.1 sigma-54-dependent Fis family transcriptional regulator [Bacteroidales bacterium]